MKAIRILVRCVCLLAMTWAAACSPAAETRSPVPVTVTPPFPPPAVSTNLSIDKQVAQLLENYQRALDEELMHGDTTIVKNANGSEQKKLTGKSRAKLDQLWENTAYTIDNLKARPAAEHQKVIDRLEARLNKNTSFLSLLSLTPDPVAWSWGLDYVETTRLPAYSQSARVEVYRTMVDKYSIDIASGQVIEIGPALLLLDPPYPSFEDLTPDQLEQGARHYIVDIGANVDLSALTPVFNNQYNTFYFRWEDHSRKQPDGEPHFIQVVYDKGGFLESYTNTLPLP